MPGVANVIVKDVLTQLDSLHSEMISRDWKHFSRADFVAQLDRAIIGLAKLGVSLKKLDTIISEQAAGEKPDLTPLLTELEKLSELVKKNKDMELHKKRSSLKDINVLEQEESPELYALLEQKILSFLLKARHTLERVSLFLHKHMPHHPIIEKGTARNLLALLEQKESELSDMRKKYGGLRAKSFMGHLEENAVADLEKSVNSTSSSLAVSMGNINHVLSLNHKKLVALDNEHAQLRESISRVEGEFSDFVEKALELISLLKKERDYARRVVLEIEHETARLRSTYTTELLELEKEKVAAREHAKKALGKRLSQAEAELTKAEKNEAHFRELVLDYRNTIKELRGQIAALKSMSRKKPHKHSKKKKKK